MLAGENLVSKDHRIHMQIFFEWLWGETWHVNEKSGRQRKIWITALKFDEYCNRKFDKRRILISTGFVERPGYYHSGFLRDSS